MTPSKQLVPVSFHLRNFNKYTQLDLAASELGNLTLIGENAAGKTTLANCFFPLLVDGSIATPSFNPAKGTDRIETTGKPRNSARDTRTFDSMLLGWGTSAMKVRTGYTYMKLMSARRQVILGIGAHRTVGENRKPTWWFVVISDQLQPAVDVVTTTADGRGLDKDAFIAANAALGTTLKVFDQALAYQTYVASNVYGFNGSMVLEKLAAVYRLLASPILTAGNARFTPIREALKNAQEGIDVHVIRQVADSQRELNRMNGVLQRITRVRERLARMKKEIFWRNLNRLDDDLLSAYGKAHQGYAKRQTAQNRYQKQIDDYTEQLTLLVTTLAQAQTTLTALREAQAQQAEIVGRRKLFAEQIQSAQVELANYQRLQTRLAKSQAELLANEQQQAALTVDQDHLKIKELQPLQTELSTKTTELPALKDAIAEVDLRKQAQQLSHYIQQNRSGLRAYEANQAAQAHLSQDVEIVHDMRVDLDTHINQRAQGPMTGRLRAGLLQDNLTVHNRGAEKMNAQLAPLLAEEKQLLQQYPDLKVLLNQPDILDWLGQRQKELVAIIKRQEKLTRQLDSLLVQHANLNDRIQEIKVDLPANFDETTAQKHINDLKAQRAALKVDDALPAKLKQAEQNYQQLMVQQNEFNSKKSELQGQLTTTIQAMQTYQAELKQLATEIDAAIRTLSPYFPDNLQLGDVAGLITYVQQHRSEVRNALYGDLTSKLSKLIHQNDQNGIDRYAVDDLFEERGHSAEASAIRQQRSIIENKVTIVAFDINHAQDLMAADEDAVTHAVEQLNVGNDVAQVAYLSAATNLITAQYRLIAGYNEMLTAGVNREQSIKLKITLEPTEVAPEVIDEARDAHLKERPALLAEVKKRLEHLANDTTVADDDDAFMTKAETLLDTRQWSAFKVLIKRRQNGEDEYEEVDDKFVQSGGSGAEKAQAMVLPLL